jgi:hypothetical protein
MVEVGRDPKDFDIRPSQQHGQRAGVVGVSTEVGIEVNAHAHDDVSDLLDNISSANGPGSQGMARTAHCMFKNEAGLFGPMWLIHGSRVGAGAARSKGPGRLC